MLPPDFGARQGAGFFSSSSVMPDNADDIERDALDMIKQYGDAAARIARVRAEIAENNIHNPRLARMWRDLAGAIERLPPKP